MAMLWPKSRKLDLSCGYFRFLLLTSRIQESDDRYKLKKMKRSRVPPIVAALDNEVEQEEEEDRKNRFNHLLKPIRDLAENFNINLACELEEYLDELETITISFNDEEGIKQLNFAEAALLIRGSSLIYSKKVDYLYDLVFKVLDNVTAQKDKRIRVDLHNDDNEDESGDAGGKKTSSSQADFVDAFLALDDIQEAQNISLNNEALSGQQQPPEWDVDARRSEALNFTVPLAFLQAANVQGSSDGFKLSTAHVHASGALLLSYSSTMQYKSLSDNTTSLCLNTSEHHGNDFFEYPRQISVGGSPGNDGSFGGGGMDDMYGDGGMDDYGGMDDDFGDAGGVGGSFEQDAVVRSPFASGENVVSQRLFPSDDSDARETTVNRASDPGHFGATSTVDHWIMWGPHEHAHRGSRPFRSGKMR